MLNLSKVLFSLRMFSFSCSKPDPPQLLQNWTLVASVQRDLNTITATCFTNRLEHKVGDK